MSDTFNQVRLKELLKRHQFADEVVVRERVAVWKITWGDVPGAEVPHVTSRNPETNAEKSCAYNTLLEISGSSVTDGTGKLEFRLSDVWCYEGYAAAGRLAFDFPIVCVATAQTDQPVFLTSLQRRVAAPPNPPGIDNDIQVEVFSWGPTGSPLANVVFDWHCRVPLTWWSEFWGSGDMAPGKHPATRPVSRACPRCGA
jgi:hypothetical protein